MSVLGLPLLLSLIVQHEASPPPPDPFAVLTEQVREAHGATTKAITDRFIAHVQITPPADEQDHVVVSLDVRFWREGGARTRSLIRYRVDERGKKLERGIDKRGPWNRIGDEVTGLGSKEDQTAREEVQRHVRLAKQMLEFLDPGKLLDALEDKAPVRDAELKLSRTESVACKVVSGTAASFPLYGTAGEGQPARVSLWIETATHRLAAVDIHPLDKDGKPLATGERVRLKDHTTQDGLVLPTLLLIYDLERASAKAVTVTLMKLDLAPTLTEASFDREQDW